MCKYCEKFVLETAQKAEASEKDHQLEKKDSDINFCSSDSSETDSSPTLSLLHNLSIVNNALDILGIKKISEHQLTNANFITKKVEEMTTVVHQMLEVIPPKDVGKQIINNFISQFEDLSGADKYRVLTSIPNDISSEFLVKTFGISHFKANRAKEILAEKGIMSAPDPKIIPKYTQDTLDCVKKFYESDKISRQMPGRKDCVTLKVFGEKKSSEKNDFHYDKRSIHHVQGRI